MAFDVREMARTNSILAALPPEELEDMVSHLKPLELPVTEIIHDQGVSIDSVYFVTSGMVSIVLTTIDGTEVEVGMVGAEGVVGAGPALGGMNAFGVAAVQISGEGLRMPAGPFIEKFGQYPALRKGVLKALNALSNQNAQCGVCNQMHSITERLSRWLLMAHDRAGTDVMDLTHEYLASMLGARRPGVTLAAGQLRRAGLIEYSRGAVTVKDRAGLEAAACECYALLRKCNSA